MGNQYRRLQAAAMLAKQRHITLEQAEEELQNMDKEVKSRDRKVVDVQTERTL